MDNNLILKTLIGPDVFGSAGQLTPEQAKQFVTYVTDEQVVLKECDFQQITPFKKEINLLGIGSRLLRADKAGVTPTGIDVTPTKKEINTVPVKLISDIHDNSLDENIEQDKLVDTLMRIIGTQMGNDLEDLAFNGNTASADEFLQIHDGWLKLALSCNIYDHNGSSDYKAVVFPGMLAAMPNKYKAKKTDLRFYVAPSVEEAYRVQLAGLYGEAGGRFMLNDQKATFQGIPVVAAPYVPSTHHVLTHPLNLVYAICIAAIRKEIQRDAKAGVTSIVMRTRCDAKIKNDEALVLSYNA